MLMDSQGPGLDNLRADDRRDEEGDRRAVWCGLIVREFFCVVNRQGRGEAQIFATEAEAQAAFAEMPQALAATGVTCSIEAADREAARSSGRVPG